MSVDNRLALRSALKKYRLHPNFLGDDLVSADQRGSDGDSPLHIAAATGEVADVLLFLEACKDIDQLGDKGHTPLHYAAIFGHLNVVKLLIEKGASLEVVSEFGDTPLQAASRNGKLQVAKALNAARAID